MAEPWESGAWAPGAWAPGAWTQSFTLDRTEDDDVLSATLVITAAGGVVASLDVTEGDDLLEAAATFAQPQPSRESGGLGGGGGGGFSIAGAKAWLSNLVSSPGGIFEEPFRYPPRHLFAKVAANEEDDTLSASVEVTGRSRRARDEEYLLRRAA